MKDILNKIINFESIDYLEAKKIIQAIISDELNEFQLVALMTGLQMKGLELNELQGFQDALLENAVELDLSSYNGIDLCGTGGDGKNTFNISTCTSLILASMSYKVIKHGNYGVSSISGSSNVLEYLGFIFPKNQEELEESIEKTNLAIIHAPLFHPALKKVGKIRKELGIRTFFNCLGPLINPAKPTFQMTGTYSLELAKIYHFLLKDIRENHKIVYGLAGYDELTLLCPTKIYSKTEEKMYGKDDFAVQGDIYASDLYGGATVSEAAKILSDILEGKGSKAQTDVIAANVSAAIHCMKPESDLKANFIDAKEHILSGKSYQFFKLNEL
jgi:anthranilate phosphoribosyltransferase